MSSYFSTLPRYHNGVAPTQRGIYCYLEAVDRGKDFFMLGKPKRFEFREDTLAIDDHFEGATVAFE